MTRDDAASLLAQINSVAGWCAWPAKGTKHGVPLIWFTRIDGSTRIYHATHVTDWYAALNEWERKGAASVHRD